MSKNIDSPDKNYILCSVFIGPSVFTPGALSRYTLAGRIYKGEISSSLHSHLGSRTSRCRESRNGTMDTLTETLSGSNAWRRAPFFRPDSGGSRDLFGFNTQMGKGQFFLREVHSCTPAE